MTYSYPEMSVLGEATDVIQGSKIESFMDFPVDLPGVQPFEIEE